MKKRITSLWSVLLAFTVLLLPSIISASSMDNIAILHKPEIRITANPDQCASPLGDCTHIVSYSTPNGIGKTGVVGFIFPEKVNNLQVWQLDTITKMKGGLERSCTIKANPDAGTGESGCIEDIKVFQRKEQYWTPVPLATYKYEDGRVLWVTSKNLPPDFPLIFKVEYRTKPKVKWSAIWYRGPLDALYEWNELDPILNSSYTRTSKASMDNNATPVQLQIHDFPVLLKINSSRQQQNGLMQSDCDDVRPVFSNITSITRYFINPGSCSNLTGADHGNSSGILYIWAMQNSTHPTGVNFSNYTIEHACSTCPAGNVLGPYTGGNFNNLTIWILPDTNTTAAGGIINRAGRTTNFTMDPDVVITTALGREGGPPNATNSVVNHSIFVHAARFTRGAVTGNFCSEAIINNLFDTNQATLEFWIRFPDGDINTSAAFTRLFEWWNAAGLAIAYVDNVNNLNVWGNDGTTVTLATLTGANTIQDNQWHYLVVTHNSSRWAIYRDGVYVNSAAAAGISANAAVAANIGGGGEGGCDSPASTKIGNMLANVRVWNKAMNDTWVKAVYDNIRSSQPGPTQSVTPATGFAATIVVETPVSETRSTNQTLQIVLTGASIFNDTNASLYWNNTYYGPATQIIINTTRHDYYFNQTLPLVTDNQTNSTARWSWNVAANDGSTDSGNTSTTQQVLWSFFPTQLYGGGSFIETTPRTISVLAVNRFPTTSQTINLSMFIHFAGQQNNGTLQSNVSGVLNWTHANDTGLIGTAGNNLSIGLNATLQIQFQNLTRTRNLSTSEFMYRMVLTDCTAGSMSSNETANFTVRRETDPGIAINTTVQQNFQIWTTDSGMNRTYGFSPSQTDLWHVCVYPTINLLNQTFNSRIRASVGDGTTWEVRSYEHTTTLNQTREFNYSYYIVNSTETSAVTITVVDENTIIVPGAYIETYRYNLANNTEFLVISDFTDTEGRVVQDLVLNDVYYRFRIYSGDGNTLRHTTARMKIFGTTLTIRISPSALISRWEIYRSLASSYTNLSFINSTREYIFIYDHTNVSTNQFNITNTCLIVNYLIINSSNSTEFTRSCSATTSGTLTATINTTYSYVWTGYGTVFITTNPSLEYILEMLGIDLSEDFDRAGLFVALILMVSLFMIGLWNPVVAIGLTTVGFGFSIWLGLVNIGIGAIIGIVTLTLIAILALKS